MSAPLFKIENFTYERDQIIGWSNPGDDETSITIRFKGGDEQTIPCTATGTLTPHQKAVAAASTLKNLTELDDIDGL